MTSYTVESDFFKNSKLTIEPAGFFKGPVLKIDGKVVVLKKKKVQLMGDDENNHEVSISSNPFEAYPWISVDGIKLYPMGKLSTLEQTFVYLPLSLLAIGGGIGGAIGVFASMTNASLMREYKDSKMLKFGLSLVTTFLAAAIWYLLAVMINTAAKR